MHKLQMRTFQVLCFLVIGGFQLVSPAQETNLVESLTLKIFLPDDEPAINAKVYIAGISMHPKEDASVISEFTRNYSIPGIAKIERTNEWKSNQQGEVTLNQASLNGLQDAGRVRLIWVEYPGFGRQAFKFDGDLRPLSLQLGHVAKLSIKVNHESPQRYEGTELIVASQRLYDSVDFRIFNSVKKQPVLSEAKITLNHEGRCPDVEFLSGQYGISVDPQNDATPQLLISNSQRTGILNEGETRSITLQPYQTIRLKGKVVSAGDNQPISKAKVMMAHRTYDLPIVTGLTDENGEYSFETAPGTLAFRLLDLGEDPNVLQRHYVSSKQIPFLLSKQPDEQTAPDLIPDRKTRLTGQIQDQSGAPIPNTLFAIRSRDTRPSSKPLEVAQSDQFGIFRMYLEPKILSQQNWYWTTAKEVPSNAGLLTESARLIVKDRDPRAFVLRAVNDKVQTKPFPALRNP